ncbi:MAG: hypothetical protein ACT6T3_22465, partial [Agrobacterium sp.]|uniref:hypothetical protein n=1 Tax=Agrobacterium sp. TaxID=361 RepID=UPI0040345383
MRKSAALNLAAAHLKQQSWAAAAKEASRVLEQDSFNVKALYRRAQVPRTLGQAGGLGQGQGQGQGQ